MGVSKRGPIVEGRDRLLLEFTDGSECISDGQKLTYTTRIHLVCSRGSQVSVACDKVERRLLACLFFFFLHVSEMFVCCFAVNEPVVPDVPELHRQLQVGDEGSVRHHHHQEQREFISSTEDKGRCCSGELT